MNTNQNNRISAPPPAVADAPRKKPVHELRLGLIKAAIWENTVGDSPTGTAGSHVAKRPPHWLEPLLTFRPASRRAAQASRLCYPNSIFQTRSQAASALVPHFINTTTSAARDFWPRRGANEVS